jgi:hypothetical protein
MTTEYIVAFHEEYKKHTEIYSERLKSLRQLLKTNQNEEFALGLGLHNAYTHLHHIQLCSAQIQITSEISKEFYFFVNDLIHTLNLIKQRYDLTSLINLSDLLEENSFQKLLEITILKNQLFVPQRFNRF